MTYTLAIFVDTPLEQTEALGEHDDGFSDVAIPSSYQGRACLAFEIPASTPNAHGFRITITAPNKRTEQKGILYLRSVDWEDDYPWLEGQTAALAVDDFTLQSVAPEPAPLPPSGSLYPLDVIQHVYESAPAGTYDFMTKEGCGKFTEDCCIALHDSNDRTWGHIHKNDNQNGWPPVNTPDTKKHAIDAIQVLRSYSVQGDTIVSGTYDIVKGAEAPGAEPAFNRVDDSHADLWFYPA